MIKKIILTLIFIIICAAAGGYFYVTNIDWNKNKDVIAEKVFEATGKKVIFNGPVSLSFIPTPVLKASDVLIINPNDTNNDEPLMSIKSLNSELDFLPLLKGSFNVKIISLMEPKINVIKTEDGEFNWLKNIDNQAIEKLKNANLVFNSLTLQKATFYFEDQTSLKKLELKNLNAEILANSLLGPFNIDGTYLNGEEPSGFSISLGELSNRFATTLNFAISYPKSQSALRFDGSFLTENNSFNADVVFNTKNLKEFVDTKIDGLNLDNEYNYPLIFNFEVSYNKEKTDISNFVFEYGGSKGAGEAVIPHNIENKNVFMPKIEANINLTDFDATPFVYFVKSTIKEESFAPVLEFDLKASLKALKTTYNNEVIENFGFDAEINQSVFSINNFTADMLDDTNLTLNGSFYSSDQRLLTYAFDTSFNTANLYNFLSWINIKPTRYNENAYKKASLFAKIEGNTKQLKIFDINATVDKTALSGNIGAIVGQRNNFFFDMDLNSLNIDDYLKPINEGGNALSLLKIIELRLKSLVALEGVDAQINLGIDALTLNKMPFENVDISADALLGDINISNLEVKNFNGSELLLSGKIKDIKNDLLLENIKYSVQSNDINATNNYFKIRPLFINANKLNKFSQMGVLSGYFNNFNTKTILSFNEFNYTFNGNVKNALTAPVFDGSLSLNATDFIEFANLLGFDYKPNTLSLGTLNLKADIKGGFDAMSFDSAAILIGANSFNGSFDYENKTIPNINADFSINKFDTKRFFYNPVKTKNNVTVFNKQSNKKATFIEEPDFSDDIINYDFYKKFNLKANLSFDELDVEENKFMDASALIEIKDNVINITDFNAAYNNGKLNFDSQIFINSDAPIIKGSANISGQQLSNIFNQKNARYGIDANSFSIANAKFETSASSVAEALYNLDASFKISVDDLVFRGLGFSSVKDDLLSRTGAQDINEDFANKITASSFEYAAFNADVVIKNSEFSLTQQVSLPKEKIDFDVKGSIKNWTIDLNAKTTFVDDLKYLPSFDLKLAGSLATPSLTLKLDAIVKMLNDRENEFERQKQQRMEDSNKKLQDAMKSLQATSELIAQDVNLIKKTELSHFIKNASTNSIKEEYLVIEKEADSILSDIDKVVLYKSAVDISEELLTSLENINKGAQENLILIQQKVEKTQIKDYTQKIINSLNLIKEDNSLALRISKEYNQEYNKTIDKLKSINSLVDLKSDKDTNGLSLKIAKIVSNTNQIYNAANLISKELGATIDVAALTKASKKIEELAKNITIEKDNLIKAERQAIETIENIYNIEETNYKKAKEKAAIEAKIKENTATIDIEDKGKLTLRKDIAEIIKEEKVIEKNNLKVLDFSKPIDNNKKENIADKKSDGVIIISD